MLKSPEMSEQTLFQSFTISSSDRLSEEELTTSTISKTARSNLSIWSSASTRISFASLRCVSVNVYDNSSDWSLITKSFK